MSLKLFFACSLMSLNSALLAAELGQLTLEQLESLQQRKNPLLIDIRIAGERERTDIIPGCHRLQSFDEDVNFDRAKWLAGLTKLQKDGERPIVQVYRSQLAEQMDMKNVYHLSNGINEWLQSGHNAQSACAPNKTC